MDNPLSNPVSDLGMVADIYAWPTGQVLKLFRAGWPQAYAQHEAQLTRAVQATGLAVPVVGAEMEINGRFGFLLEYVPGPALFEVWLSAPEQPAPVAHLLADLHATIHTCPLPALATLPAQREWLGNNIQDTPACPAPLKAQVLRLLAGLPDAHQLCHGDFHPGNILLKNGQTPIIIDWFSAVRGHPVADVAYTALALEYAPLPPGLDAARLQPWREALTRAYLAHYFQQQPAAAELLAAWRIVVTAANLGSSLFPQAAPALARLHQWLAEINFGLL